MSSFSVVYIDVVDVGDRIRFIGQSQVWTVAFRGPYGNSVTTPLGNIGLVQLIPDGPLFYYEEITPFQVEREV